MRIPAARVVVPELPDGRLPVFVLDEYEGLDAGYSAVELLYALYFHLT